MATDGIGSQAEDWPPPPPAVALAVGLLGDHPRVERLSARSPTGTRGRFDVDVMVRLELPFSWMARGRSPNGVRVVEPATLSFPAAYPLRAPTVSLRADFDRSLAHVQPGPADGPVIPCLVDGDLDEFLHSQGLLAIIDQLVVWLEKAAAGELIDPAHGWEPVRRDTLEDLIIADADHIRGLVSRQESRQFFTFNYVKMIVDEGLEDSRKNYVIRSSVGLEPLTVSGRTLETRKIFQAGQLRDGLFEGRSIALVVTPGKLGSGELHVAGRYQPETVVDLAGLKERAAAYGCLGSLEAALKWLGRCVKDFTSQGAAFPMAVILCARRRFHLIGQTSEIEIVPYIVEVGAPELFAGGDQTAVFPTAHRHSISAELLRRMSGAPELPEGRDVVLVGCGSLGSKIGVHLARSGAAPSAIVDRRSLSPHNAARHALLPHTDGLQITWMDNKAQALARAIEGLGQSAKAFSEDVTRALYDDEVLRRLFPRRTWAVINTTASLAAREALAAIGPARLRARAIETSLLARGTIGVMTIEGLDRNPNCSDLAAELYEFLRADERLRQEVFEGEEPARRHEIGEGCGSMTMVIPDAKISLFAAAMAQGIATMRAEDLADTGGRVLVGRLTENGMGLSWMSHDVRPVQLVPTEDGGDDWVVRLSDRAHEKIARDCTAHADVETGGVLVGRISETQRAFLVTDALPAPEDSVRTPAEFVLGTRGVLKMLEGYSQSCQGALYCLGTWHSHLVDSGPSGLDRRTARTLAVARSVPSVMLIRTPSSYRALVVRQPARDGRQEASQGRFDG